MKLTVLRGSGTNEMEAIVGDLPAAERSRIYSEENARTFFQNWLREQLGEGGEQSAEKN